MRSALLCAFVLACVIDQESAEAAESTEAISQESGPSFGDPRPEPSRTIGRLGMGAQLGGFYDLGDPALELRAWAKRNETRRPCVVGKAPRGLVSRRVAVSRTRTHDPMAPRHRAMTFLGSGRNATILL